MIQTGLVSVTFRQLSPEEIVNLVQKAGLQGIEWGGDIHVPHGNYKRAHEVANLTRDHGLTVAAYGSYYKVGSPDAKQDSFENIIETAVNLGAPTIRIWAGHRGSREVDDAGRDKIIQETREMADLAGKSGIRVAFEYHGNTLTDSLASAVSLMQEINHSNVYVYWQPSVVEDLETRISGLKQLLPWLDHVHAFHWKKNERLPFIMGQEEWLPYIQLLKEQAENRFVLLEFVKDNDPVQFIDDAQTLLRLLDKETITHTP